MSEDPPLAFSGRGTGILQAREFNPVVRDGKRHCSITSPSIQTYGRGFSPLFCSDRTRINTQTIETPAPLQGRHRSVHVRSKYFQKNEKKACHVFSSHYPYANLTKNGNNDRNGLHRRILPLARAAASESFLIATSAYAQDPHGPRHH